jgi:16S rRNA (adenine1518-N6/adenine1519-N6)-dimethyltransferase
VFLVQEEVARRLAAEPGSKEYGRLSIISRLYGTVELFRTVAPSAFTPVPEVTSRIGVHVARTESLPVPSVPAFEEMVRRLFSSRRKQLRNLMPRVIRSPTSASRVARSAGWPEEWPTLRPESLPPEAYFALARAIPPDPDAR